MSTRATRNQILDALTAYIAAGLGTSAGLVQRRVRLRSSLAESEFPAVFVRHVGDNYLPPPGYGMPSILSLKVEVYIFDKQNPTDPDTLPSSGVETLLDALETLFSPTLANEPQTLSGLVYSVVLTGEAPIDSGDISGDLAAQIPLRITVP